MLQAGAVISAALITGIRSDLPGQITAQVTENIYDSPTGRILLVPQGTRIIGEYSNDVGYGQRRVLLVWGRLIFPNGCSIVLERQPGADPMGWIMTIVLGVLGAFAGGWAATQYGLGRPMTWVVAVAAAVVLLFLYEAARKKKA